MMKGLFGGMLALGLLSAMGSLAADTQANPVPALGQNAADVKAYSEAKKGPRVLFVGNSITLHGPRESIGWTGNWGMAASLRDKDYVHRLQAKIVAVQSEAQCCLLQVAGSFERSFFKPDWDCAKLFSWARAFRPDVIVLFYGANVPKEYDAGTMTPAPARTYAEALEAFVRYLDPDGKALVLFSEGYYDRPKLDAEKADVCKRLGGRFVRMDDIRKDPASRGRYNHPSDRGMEMIADRFWENIEQRIRDFKAE